MKIKCGTERGLNSLLHLHGLLLRQRFAPSRLQLESKTFPKSAEKKAVEWVAVVVPRPSEVAGGVDTNIEEQAKRRDDSAFVRSWRERAATEG